MKKINKLLEYADRKTGVWAAVSSLLTLFSLLSVMAERWYESLPSMDELVCGQVIWTGYAKQADLTLVRWIIVALPALYILFYLLVCLIRKKRILDPREAAVATGGYFLCAVLTITRRAYAWQYGLTFAVLLAGFLLLKRRDAGMEAGRRLIKNVQAALLGDLAAVSLVLAAGFKIGAAAMLWQEYGYVLHLVFPAIFLLLCAFSDGKGHRADDILWLQPLLPLGFLGMARFHYVFAADGSRMELFGGGRWKLFCFLLVLLMGAVCVWQLAVHGKRLTWTTFVCAACLRTFTQPDGLMSIDFFHNGELTLPMQQWLNYQRAPYKGLVPIHGLCDYYYGALCRLFFDGSYLSLNAAKIVGGLIMAVLLATVVYLFVSGSEKGLLLVYFAVPYLVCQAGLRYLLLFILFLVLFSDKTDDGFWYIFAWVLLSIFATAWNASIGGAAAIGFLPAVLYRAARVLPKQLADVVSEKKRGKLMLMAAAFVLLLAVGISYIPLFARIVEYLKDNAGTTTYVNGMEMFEGVAAEQLTRPDFVFTAFGFSIPILLCANAMLRKRKRAAEYLVTLLTCFAVFVSYAFVRFDEGLRAAVMGTFFTLLIMIVLLCRKADSGSERDGALRACLFCTVFLFWLTDTSPWITPDSLAMIREVPASVETTIMGKTVDDPIVYVSGDSVGIPGLGAGFVQGNTLNSLCNVRDVLTAYSGAGKTCLDLTNQVANAVVFDLDNFWTHTSAYNISNDRMQRKAIECLNKQLPDMILVAPEIVFDDAPFALRSPLLYQYLMEQGYRTCRYRNVIYLVRGEDLVPEALYDEESLAELWHKKALGFLPAVWGSSSHHQLEDVSARLPAYTLQKEDDGFSVVFDEPVSGRAFTLLSLAWNGLPLQREGDVRKDASDEEAEQARMELSFLSSLGEGEEEVSLVFSAAGSDSFLLPVGLTPYFTLSEEVDRLHFTCDADMDFDPDKIQIAFYRFR